MKTNTSIVKKLTMTLDKNIAVARPTGTDGVFMGDVNRTLRIAVAGSNR